MCKSKIMTIGGMAVAGCLFFAAPVYAEVEVFQSGPGVESSAAVVEETTVAESQPETVEEEIISKETKILERFHSEFDLYEGSIQDKYFFYCNISNGGITSEPVYFEIPAELQVALEKDGTPVLYESGQQITDPGNYLLHLSVSEQVKERQRIDYKAVFRFKIQEKTAENTVASETEAEEYENITSETSEAFIDSKETTDAVSEWDMHAKDSGKTRRDEDDRFYYTFQNGVKLISSVPNGMMTSKAVSLEINGDENYRIYRDNEEIEWDKDSLLQDNGDYVVTAEGETFCFRISSYQSNSPWYYPPDGFLIKSAEFQNNQINMSRRDCLEVRRDGTYLLNLESSDGFTLECTFERDTVPPECEVTLSAQGAAVVYNSNDIGSIEIYKDGKKIGPSYNNSYEEGGTYLMVVRDLAGNQTVKEFTVPFHMNGFTIALIVMVTLVAALVAGWFFIMKKKIRVR